MQTKVQKGLRKILIALVLIGALFVIVPALNVAHAEDAPPPPPAETPASPPEAPPAESTPPAETVVDLTPPVDEPPADSSTVDSETPATPDTATDGTPAPDGTEASGTEGLPEGTGTVETGDATATTDTENGANENSETTPTTGDTSVTNTNDADVGNTSEAEAQTGGNVAAGSGGATGVTGNALASSNVINVVNTNLINSTGIFAFLNALFGGGFNLRDFDLSYFFGGSATGGCSLSSCPDGNLTVTNGNDATVNNDITVNASTGGNSAQSGSGDSSILTGDAYASANVINVVNTNIVNSNYLLIAANNFGDMAGDILLPNSDFFDQLLASRPPQLPGNLDVDATNNASVTNNLDATADTGGNTSTSSDGGDASVTTGNANAAATTYNQVNQTQVGGTTFYMLINILGSWTGNVYGLPAGISWTRTPTGIALTSNSGGMPNLGCCGQGSTSVSNTNSATVNNNVSVYALTGENYASSGSGDASVNTGNAYASANVVNIVNTNVVGQNWLFAIFNIFGNWTGNLTFGQPDLWVGAVAETETPTMPGAHITYKFTVANRGLEAADHVVFRAHYPSRYLTFNNATPDESGDGSMVWNLGTLEPGDKREFTYDATAGVVDYGQEAIVPLVASVSGDPVDADEGDNTERVAVVIGRAIKVTGYAIADKWTSEPGIHVEKTASVDETTIPATVDYKVVVVNTGEQAYDAKLTDILSDPKGKLLYSRSWKLDTIKPGEEITLSYSIQFGGGLDVGKYVNTARVTGTKFNSTDAYSSQMTPVETKHTLRVTGVSLPKVLGVSTKAQECTEYITDYIKPGEANDPVQVRRLKIFLNVFEHESLTINGEFDSATDEAVQKFQKKYSTDILSPWGIGDATGNVYYTTRKLVNELYCKAISAKEFPLSPSQQNEILAYRNVYGFGAGADTAEHPAKILTEEMTQPMPKIELGDMVPRAPKKAPFFLGFFEWGAQLFSVIPAHAAVK